MFKVFLNNIGDQLENDLRQAIDYVGLAGQLNSGKTIFIKPNLTYPKFKPGVITTPKLLETLVRIIKDYTSRIIIGESDGGYNAYEVKDTFRDCGFYELEKKYGVRIVNLSKMPFHYLTVRKFGREFKIELPDILSGESDAFISLPVPKVHAMTGISLSYKNQWGCVPNVMRLRYHPVFDEAVFAINQAIKNKFSIIDGTYGLTRSGPMAGEAFALGWFLAANSLEAANLIAARLMKVDLKKIRHYRLAYKNNLVPAESEIMINQDYRPFISDKFYLKRDIWNYLALLAWTHPAINYTFYESPISALLHKIMYTIRERPISD